MQPFSASIASTRMQRFTSAKKELPKEVDTIDAQTQERRDGKRKQILMSELELEQKALATAKTQRPSDVLLHEKNIELLKKEINALK